MENYREAFNRIRYPDNAKDENINYNHYEDNSDNNSYLKIKCYSDDDLTLKNIQKLIR